MPPTEAERAEITRLRRPRTIRACAERMLDLAQQAELTHFGVDLRRLPAVADRVVRLIRSRYAHPAAIPYHSRWRHFAAGGVDRAAAFERRLAELGGDSAERLRARFDLVLTSVLLDAGAGAEWAFREFETGLVFTRSEGLAVASYHLFVSGGLSSDRSRPLQADPDGLEALTERSLARAFQVSESNPLVGLPGRVRLLQRLGAAMRVGHLADVLRSRVTAGKLPVSIILGIVLDRLSTIWPGRHEIAGINLGDVWPHPRIGFVPLHKLSQWLTYSLLEPLEAAGVGVADVDDLTGLAEYRNGGLFLDAGVLVPKRDDALSHVYPVDSELVVEWRALTVALLDRTADEVRRLLAVDAQALPLAKVLEGGTWAAGREIAHEQRPGGGPPLVVKSDGTVF